MSSPEAESHIFDTVAGAVELRASDGRTLRDFYAGALGLSASDADRGVELRDSEGRLLVVIDAESAAGAAPDPNPGAGLFHTAFRYRDRAALGTAVKRASEGGAAYQGASDHGVSEAVYFGDPEGNGIELYRDRPFADWPASGEGVEMVTLPLDLRRLLADAGPEADVASADVGHVHLQVSDLDASVGFYRDVLGFAVRQMLPGAGFLAEGLYHHHLGMNAWHSAGRPAAPPDRPGLTGYELALLSADAVATAAERAAGAGHAVESDADLTVLTDPDGLVVRLRSRA